MAEIHVQAKKDNSSTWLWILISIVVVAAIAFILIWNKRETKTSSPNQTSYIEYQHDLPEAA